MAEVGRLLRLPETGRHPQPCVQLVNFFWRFPIVSMLVFVVVPCPSIHVSFARADSSSHRCDFLPWTTATMFPDSEYLPCKNRAFGATPGPPVWMRRTEWSRMQIERLSTMLKVGRKSARNSRLRRRFLED